MVLKKASSFDLTLAPGRLTTLIENMSSQQFQIGNPRVSSVGPGREDNV